MRADLLAKTQLTVHGNDYDTLDGTGVRDYIHVLDLAEGHLAALSHPAVSGKMAVYNLSTGTGTSVLQLVHAFEKVSGKSVTYQIGPRRPGDVASCYAGAEMAGRKLGWLATHTIEDGCRDSWQWQSNNPEGYCVETPICSTH